MSFDQPYLPPPLLTLYSALLPAAKGARSEARPSIYKPILCSWVPSSMQRGPCQVPSPTPETLHSRPNPAPPEILNLASSLPGSVPLHKTTPMRGSQCLQVASGSHRLNPKSSPLVAPQEPCPFGSDLFPSCLPRPSPATTAPGQMEGTWALQGPGLPSGLPPSNVHLPSGHTASA